MHKEIEAELEREAQQDLVDAMRQWWPDFLRRCGIPVDVSSLDHDDSVTIEPRGIDHAGE